MKSKPENSALSDFAGRVALVTAASKGLGAEIALQLARRGADVAITYLSDKAAARQVERSIAGLGRRCLTFQANAADFDRARQIVAEVRKKLGGLHVLVCNAGIARSAPLAEMSESDWDDVMDVSLKGAFNYMRAAADGFLHQEYGKVVCIGSINGLRGRMGSASYNTAKAGLLGLVKTAASEWGRNNVNVNLVAPGFIDVASQAATPALIRNVVLNECAIKRFGTPQDIAPLVVFLCSDQARHITGQIIKADAGQYL